MSTVDRLQTVLGDAIRVETSYDVVTVDVERDEWVATATALRDHAGLSFFDFLTAVDDVDRGFAVVLRLWSPADRAGVLLRTRCPRDDARVPSLTGVFAGADWHERETGEMFGIAFDGHPDLVPLLLQPDFEGHPLRKEFLLASRLDKPWPGAKEPGESDADLVGRPPRRKNLPPGVPPPGARP